MAVNAQGPAEAGPGREHAAPAPSSQLFAVSEAYPDLKANQNFLNLQEELTGTEDKIAYARQFYNDTVYKLQHQDPVRSRPTSSPGPSTSRSGSTSRPTTTRVVPSTSRSPRPPAWSPRCTTRSSRTSAGPRCSILAFVVLRRRGGRGLRLRSSRSAGSAWPSRSCSRAVASFISYWNSDKVALSLSHAQPADPHPVRRASTTWSRASASPAACPSPGSTSSTTPRPTPSPPDATPSTPPSRSRRACSRR